MDKHKQVVINLQRLGMLERLDAEARKRVEERLAEAHRQQKPLTGRIIQMVAQGTTDQST